MIEYRLFRAEDEDSYDIDSLDLSQDEQYYYADGQNKQNINFNKDQEDEAKKDQEQLAFEDDQKIREQKELAEYHMNRGGPIEFNQNKNNIDLARAGVNDIFSNYLNSDNKPDLEKI